MLSNTNSQACIVGLGICDVCFTLLFYMYLVIKNSVNDNIVSHSSPTPDVYWERINATLPDRHIFRSFGHELQISNITEEDAGQYQCLGNNSETIVAVTKTFWITIRSMYLHYTYKTCIREIFIITPAPYHNHGKNYLNKVYIPVLGYPLSC